MARESQQHWGRASSNPIAGVKTLLTCSTVFYFPFTSSGFGVHVGPSHRGVGAFQSHTVTETADKSDRRDICYFLPSQTFYESSGTLLCHHEGTWRRRFRF